jgi:dephospho-CoA kinase
MKIIGLIGGVGSGKSTVAEIFRGLGAGVLDADRVGHEVLRLPAVRAAVGGRWGNEVIGPDGEIDRKALAQIVFSPGPAGTRELAELERITHPEIRSRLKIDAEEIGRRGVPVVILDAPVMLKAGWDAISDAIVFIDAPTDARQKRVAGRNWSPDELARREAAQESIEAKRRIADFVLDNSGDISYIQSQVERLWRSLVKTDD